MQTFVIYLGAAGYENLQIGIENNIWGHKKDVCGDIKDGDEILFLHHIKWDSENGPSPAGFPRVLSPSEFAGTITLAIQARVISNPFESNDEIWADDIYPYRYEIEVTETIGEYNLDLSNESLNLREAARTSCLNSGSPVPCVDPLGDISYQTGEFTYSENNGEYYDYRIQVQLSLTKITINLPSRGGDNQTTGRPYNDDFDRAVSNFFHVLMKNKLKVKNIYWNPSKGRNKDLPNKDRELDFEWPKTYNELGKEGFRTHLGRQMNAMGGHYQSPMSVEISRPPDIGSVLSAAIIVGCNANQEMEKLDETEHSDVKSIEDNTDSDSSNLGRVWEKEPLGPEGYVYLMTNPSFPGWIKVGMTVDTKTRERNYNTGDPYRSYKMRFRKSFSNRELAEKHAHSQIERIPNTKRIGEWFKVELSTASSILEKLQI